MMRMPGGPGGQILVLKENTKRESGFKVQLSNVSAAKMIADVIRTCLGPKSMLKMLMDPTGGIVMTNDGNAILREITVEHPAAKSLIEISRTQDEEVGDGTTSVIILAGEMMSVAEPFLHEQMHPTVIISAFRQALEDIVKITKETLSKPVDVTDKGTLMKIVKSSLGTKMLGGWGDLPCEIALDAVQTIRMEEGGRLEVDIKRYARVEKIPGGSIADSKVLNGIMVNKDVTHPKMRRKIENPRIVLLDCSLEYKKGESQTNLELSKEEDFARILQLEEDFIRDQCDRILAVKPDLVITEKGVSDLAQHFMVKKNVSVIRRVRKTDNNRIARVCGATIVNRTEELREEDVGTECGLFEIKKIGDEYFTYLVDCKNPKACTIVLRGASKDVLHEVDRNLQDAMHAARNIHVNPHLVPGGGALEMALSRALNEKAKSVGGVQQLPYKAVARALEVIPHTLIRNCGGNSIRTLTKLRAKHASGEFSTWGINGENGSLVDMEEYGIWDPAAVRLQCYKTAIETAILLLRIDDIVSGGVKKASDAAKKAPEKEKEEPQPPKDDAN